MKNMTLNLLKRGASRKDGRGKLRPIISFRGTWKNSELYPWGKYEKNDHTYSRDGDILLLILYTTSNHKDNSRPSPGNRNIFHVHIFLCQEI